MVKSHDISTNNIGLPVSVDLNKYWTSLLCGRNAVSSVASESVFENEWDEANDNFERIEIFGWPECEKINDIDEQNK